MSDPTDKLPTGSTVPLQINPGWAWYRIEQNGIPVALVEAQKAATITETWYYGAKYVEPSPAHPEGVALTFVPVLQGEFESLKVKIKVQKTFQHTLKQIV